MMPLTLAERLRIVGQWLDAQGAGRMELALTGDAIQITCDDQQGALQKTTLTRWELFRLRAHARSLRRPPFEGATPHWAPMLRSVGQMLESQQAEPHRIWSEARELRLVGNQHAEPIDWTYPFENLEQRNRTQRLLRALRATGSSMRWLISRQRRKLSGSSPDLG